MYYSIRHATTFYYSDPITESVMEVRMTPRGDDRQRCLRFQIVISPRAHLSQMQDYLGNTLHTFNIPGLHDRLAITTEATVELTPAVPEPEALPAQAWAAYDTLNLAEFMLHDMLQPGTLTAPTTGLAALAREFNVCRRDDPLTVLKQLNQAMYEGFEYDQDITDVDTQMEHVLQTRRGVCQDFTHVMIALVRGLGIPCRYVSGYLFHRDHGYDRSAVDASHAWLEAWLPGLGWLGFDPTNNRICHDRHIRVAIGRDYADVPPTRGLFRGSAGTDLKVAVTVKKLDNLPAVEEVIQPPADFALLRQQQQIQQQQQQ
ncbi:MAG: transglutaminase family protein [Anaerolineae bacterium]|jgi:transglutaminase-like putative cysteine protease|nr:transglutaminase family protein [Anaerolineae bacterium]